MQIPQMIDETRHIVVIPTSDIFALYYHIVNICSVVFVIAMYVVFCKNANPTNTSIARGAF